MRHHSLILAGLALALASGGTYAHETPGMKELGTDISNAGTTPAQNQQFMSSLAAEQQVKVKEACLVQLVEPVDSKQPVVVAFCKNVAQK